MINVFLLTEDVPAYETTKRPLSNRPKIGFQDQLWLNAGQKYCRMLHGNSAILSPFIALPFVNKIFVLSISKWPFYISNYNKVQIFKNGNSSYM